MIPFLTVLGLALTAFVGLGFYFGWFLLPSESAGGPRRITFSGAPSLSARATGTVLKHSVSADRE
jgi:hypothetical protein